MRKVIFPLIVALFMPALALAQWQSTPNYIVVTPNLGDNSSTYVSNTGDAGQIRHYSGVDVIIPYPRNEVADTQILLNNLHQSVQNLNKNDGLRSLRQKHFHGFIEDDD